MPSITPPKIHFSETKSGVLKTIRKTLHESLSSKNPLLLLFSGGSSLEILNTPACIRDASHITLSLVDERNDPTKKASNFEKFRQTPFFLDCVKKNARIIPFSPEYSSSEIEAGLRTWKQDYPTGSILAFIGMGNDGHIAGIFPTDTKKAFEELYLGSGWVVTRDIPTAPEYPTRTSVTSSFLTRETNRVFAFICGKEKRAPLKTAVFGKSARYKLPAALFQEIPYLAIFTDQDIS